MPKSVSWARPPGPDQDVGRLDVAVDDAAGVGVGQGAQHVLGHAEHRRVARRARVAQQLQQRAPVHQLPDQVEALAVLAPVAQRDDARVVEAAGGAHLGAHPRREAELDRDHLDRHLVAGHQVVGAVHDRGRPAADRRSQDVAPEGPAVRCGVRAHVEASSTTRPSILAGPGVRGHHAAARTPPRRPRAAAAVLASPIPEKAGMPGRVVELVDTLGSGSSARMSLGVRVPPRPLPPRLPHQVRTVLLEPTAT